MDLFLDSGAYSAYTRKISIDIEEYVNFIKKYSDCISVYACLDVIGDGDKTYENLKYMESLGVKPLPVYHKGCSTKYLERYLKEGYDYIALGGLVGSTFKELRLWLDYIFDKFLTDVQGYSIVKVHGFGVTGFRALQRYPWYSVDSTSWLKAAAFGRVYVPRKLKFGWDYNSPPFLIILSDQNPSIELLGKHYQTYPSIVKDVFDQYFHMIGFSAEQLMSSVGCRKKVNIRYYFDLQNNIIKKPFSKSIKGFGFFKEK